MNNPYSVLGISPSASAEEITSVYRAMAREAHPDRNGGSAASTARMAAINAAHDALKTATGRAAVDARLAAETPRPEDTKKLDAELLVQSWWNLGNPPPGASDLDKSIALTAVASSAYALFGSNLITLGKCLQTWNRPAPPPVRRRKTRGVRARA